ncbi:alkaline phosphatase D family protein [Limisalsivibrio acetivorans]|uniref:alkaline phosphatase D family protein n=1 Tax=Limisalsivibrio acetivorans TaxID=1304888 RepID=UPI0003B6DC5A|nr:alkaline phosphatase D family protein [Limisalsivibrio acetivorans]
MIKLSRRSFIKTVSVAAAGTAFNLSLTGCGGSGDEYETDTSLFPQSVVSGDPRESSVILWTRIDASKTGEDAPELSLQVATDSKFDNLVLNTSGLSTSADTDHCVKVKVTGLSPYTTYYYRFIYAKDDQYKKYTTRTARTKTAPSADADVEVKFTFLSCQDYIGRYYNSLKHHVDNLTDIDFVVYLGDYIYETTGDPQFQALEGRKINFSDTSESVQLGSGESSYYGAYSVSNYRDIYKTYRTDSVLQRFHELFPIIVIWDDHEYSDDCHAETATYFDGLKDEKDLLRRQNAEQVFYEFIPVDNTESGGQFETSDAKLIGGAEHKGIYRDFRFGKHLHLVLTDYRSFRPDHLIPEDAFPGKIVMDKAALISVFDGIYGAGAGEGVYESMKAGFGPYVDMTLSPWDAYAPALIPTLSASYQLEGLAQAEADTKAASDLSEKVSAYVFNMLVDAYNSQAAQLGLDPLPKIDDNTYNNILDRGVAYLHLGKQGNFSDIGSRYGVLKATFDLYTAYAYMSDMMAGKTPENVFGDIQQAWIDSTLTASDASNICFASSVSTNSLVWDLTSLDIPADFKQMFYANVDHWDGFPNKRKALIEQLSMLSPNTFIIAGDIHASYVGKHTGTNGTAVADFTGTSVSSKTFVGMVENVAEVILSSGAFTEEQGDAVRETLITNLDQTMMTANPSMVYANSYDHGYVTVTANGEGVQADYVLISKDAITENYYSRMDELEDMIAKKSFLFSDNNVTEI